MDCILLPSFLPPSFPKKHIQTYQSSASLLYNLIVKTDSQEFEYLLEICNILSKIYSTVSSIPELFSTSYNCAIRLSNLSCPIEMLESYYFSVLSLAKLNTKKANTEDNFNNFLSHFTLICNSIFEKFDFVQATNFYERTLESATEIFNNDDCVSVLTVMKFPLLLSPLRIEDKLESLIQCKKRLINLDTSRQQLVVKKLQKLIHTIVSTYYKSENGSEWCKITEVCQSEILHVIWEISRLELSPKFSCPCKCQIEKNLYQAFSYIQYVRPLIEMPIKQKSASSDFYRDGANLLARFSEDVKELKKYNCKKWEMVWHALATALYNIGVKIHENSDRSCLPYFYTLIKYFVKFEFRDGVNILKFSIFYVFTVVCYYNVEDYKKRMALSALGVVLCPTKRNMLILNWIKAKSNQRYVDTPECNDLQKVTLVSAHKHFRNEMDFLTDGEIFLTTADKIDLLVFELEQYKMKWKSKVPTMCALKELCDIADLHKIVEVIVNIFWDYEALVHEDVPQILQKVLKQYEEKISGQENVQSTIFSAVLYHINYKHRVKDAIAKNATDMERALPVTQKTDEPPDAIPEDPKEECDIVSSYDSLTLTRYFGVMKYLNKSLELFASAITDNFDPGSLTKITSSTIYNSLVKISMEYRLHRLSVKHLQALQLALKVAQFENNACHIIWAISYIIESSDFNKSYVKYLISVADRQLDDIERASAQNLKIILTYYMCKANSLLYEDHEEAYRMFQMANELYDVQEDKSELKLVKCQLDTLHFKFVLLPCGFGIVDHRKSTLLTIHLANKTVYELYNDSKLGKV